MNDKMIEQVLAKDFSKGTEAFQERLLKRCLAEMGNMDEGIELSDDEISMLAAAGTPYDNMDFFDTI